LERGDSSVVGHGLASYNQPDHDQQCCYCHTVESCWLIYLNRILEPHLKNMAIWFYRWSMAAAALLVVVWHDQQRCYCHAPTVKPDATNAVVSS
jgi:hypothetical protein